MPPTLQFPRFMLDASQDPPRGPAPPPDDEPHALPAGTRFGELEILRTVGVGGFGIVYLAQDHALERKVAIKEYMPGQLAQRGEGSHVSVRSSSMAETFDVGLRSFVNEARLLARFDHESLLKVYRFWEENGTAYMLMPYLHGQTLKQMRQAMTERPTEAWLRKLLAPLLDGLGLLHAESVVHRDISPDNVLLPDDGGDAILLDFGAARHAIGDQAQNLTTILKPRFAPIEQYGESAGLRQGPWTDLYALGAVVHFLLTGHTPPAATTRTVADTYEPLSRMDLPGISPRFLATIDWCLGVRPQDRPQSVAQVRAALDGRLEPPTLPAKPSRPDVVDEPNDTVMMSLSSAMGDSDVATIELPMRSPGLESLQPRRNFRSKLNAAAGQKPAGPPWLGLVLVGAGAVLAAGLVWWATADGPAKIDPVPAVGPGEVILEPQARPTDTASNANAAATPASATETIIELAPPTVVAASGAALSPVPADSRPPSSRATALGMADGRPGRDARTTNPPATAPADSAVTAPAATNADASNTAATQAAAQPASARTKPADPTDICGRRVFLAYVYCMERECAKSAYSAHPECTKLREGKAGRAEGTRSR